MTRWGPLITLGCVVLLGGILLAANSTAAKPPGYAATRAASTPAGTRAAGTPAPGRSTPALQALYAGRSSGGQASVAIAINGRRAAASIYVGAHVERTLQGSVTGDRIVLAGRAGAGLNGFVSGQAIFGTFTAGGGQSFPFSAAQAVVHSVYAGRSSGNQLTLAVSINGDKAAGYVCNGRTVQAWLQGSVTGDRIALSGHKGASLDGSISGLAMFGTVTVPADQSFPFSAGLAPDPAGVYRADVTINRLATKIGWAVLPDGTQAGVAVSGGTARPAPPINLNNGKFTIDGSTFAASDVEGTDTVVSP